jgi:hypothetical protein
MSIPASLRAVNFGPHEVQEARVDYLTCCTYNPQHRLSVLAKAKLALDQREAWGYKAKPIRVRNYAGWRADDVGYAWDPDNVYVLLSGDAAARHWREFALHADRVSRLDLAVTYRLPQPPKQLARALYDGWPHGPTGRGKPPLVRLEEGKNGGWTLKVGTPSSDRQGRVYDKGVESGEVAYADCYRWESQDRSSLALHRLRALGRAADYRRALQSDVRWYFERRGVPLPGDGPAVPLQDRVPMVRRGDPERLAYLRTYVRPTVRALVGRGLLYQVLCALGFEGDEQEHSSSSRIPPLEFDARNDKECDG